MRPASTSSPGCVDPHTHLEMPWRGETTIDDFTSGHTAAAFGGTTTHVDFCIQGKGQHLRRRTRHLAREARGEVTDRQRLPHRLRVHRPARRRHPRGACKPPRRARRHVLQALHGLQGLADGRRRDAVPHDAGGSEDGRTRDGARGERRCDRGARRRGDRRRQHDPIYTRSHARPSRRRGDEPRDPAGADCRRGAGRRPRLRAESVSGCARAREAERAGRRRARGSWWRTV